MIRRTFRILPSTGAVRERALWKEGIRDWDAFLGCDEAPGYSGQRKKGCDQMLLRAEDLRREGDVQSLASMLPRNEVWRLYDDFSEGAAFLDIETDGLGPGCEVTVVGVHSAKGTAVLVNGQDLDEDKVSEALDGATMLVTFNGSCFDVPVLAQSFPGLELSLLHLDLRFAARRVGLCGGLKAIEKRIGISRDDEVADVDGAEAVRLWNAWCRRGCSASLEKLMEYNRADTSNLPLLAKEVCSRLERLTLGDCDE